MTISDLNPHIRYARIHKTYYHMRNYVSICYDCRLFFFENIIGNIIVNEKKYNILNKTAIYLPPKTEYKFNIEYKENARLIIFDFDLVNDYSHIKSALGTATKQDFDKSKVLKYSIPSELSEPIIRLIPQIDRMLVKCTDDFLLKTPFYRENSSALLKLCLLEFIRQNSKNEHSDLCKNVLSYIHENFSDSSLTNDEIANKFSYHPYHLSRVIKEETGKTLHQYITYYRIRIAKDLLLTTKYNVSDIAWRTGFCSSAHFIKTFRQNIGMTPKEYRTSNIHTEI